MLIKTLTVGHIETNCYIVTDENTSECAIIDPGDDANTILDYIEANRLMPRAILITHGHFDHVTAMDSVRKETGATVYISRRDTSDTPHADHKCPAYEYLNYYDEGDTVTVGSLTFTVLATPGHSPGSVTLMCENALFTGDTLFRDSCGRTDIGEGNMETLMRSLRRLHDLPGDFEVYPGHMDSSTLSRERNFNYYMRYATGSE